MDNVTVREDMGVFTTIGILEHSAEMWADDVSLRIFRNRAYEEITFAEFRDRTYALAAALIKLGIEPGDKVSVLGENRPEWAIAYMAIHRAGAIGVPLDSMQKQSEFHHIMQDSGIKAIVVSERFVDDIVEVRERLQQPITVISMDENGDDDVLAMFEVMADAEIPAEWPEVKLEDLAVIIYTSGTTGQSKGVMLTHNNLGSDAAAAYRCVVFGPGDNFLSVLPLHHTFECTGGFLLVLYGGSTITYARSLKSRDIVEDIKNTKVTMMLGVPLLFEKMMQGIQRKLRQAPVSKRIVISALFGIEALGAKFGKRLGPVLFSSLREKAGMSTLRLMISGGAALAPHVGKWFNQLGFVLFQGYGLTETSPIATVGREASANFESTGEPIPGCEINIHEPDADGNGEVLIRGPIVMMGYYKNEEATKQVIDDEGWFYSGDAGHLDAEGRLHITGRKKNVIVNSAGKNIYPEEVEHYINQSPYVLESLVIGRPLPGTTSEDVICLVVPNYEYFDEMAQERETPFTTEEIETTVRAEVEEAVSNISDYKRPKAFEIREEEFEKTSTKKIKRFLYRHKEIPV